MKIDKLILVFIISIILFSCNKPEDQGIPNNSKYYVQKTLIEKISENYFNYSSSEFQSKSKAIKKIKNLKEIKNNEGKNVLYITNFENGGFLIMSADRRTLPVLAQSETNNFFGEIDDLPDGVRGWLKESIKIISQVQQSSFTSSETKKFELAWESIERKNLLGKIDPELDCPPEVVETVNPLMQTAWSQVDGFNESLHYITCGGLPFKVLAGCVPIAMAQVMKYHQYPTSYDWTNMPNNAASTTTANFILDIHGGINSIFNNEPSYSCSATGVNSSLDMGAVLKSVFNYSTATFANYNYGAVTNDIDNNKPVILAGFDSNGYGGHMWVTDGYKRTWFYQPDCTGYAYLHLYMNWGWGSDSNGNTYNGFYAFDNWSPGIYNFNVNKKMLYNIKP